MNSLKRRGMGVLAKYPPEKAAAAKMRRSSQCQKSAVETE
jgi:hypothetical protein